MRGLILAGGQSQRMGFDKTQLKVGSERWIDLLAETMTPYCSDLKVSVKSPDPTIGMDQLIDDENQRGVIDGLLRAHREDPASDWLIAACDLPMIDDAAIKGLLKINEPLVSCYHAYDRYHPLFAIWTAESLRKLKSTQGNRIQQHMIDWNVGRHRPDQLQWLTNLNRPDDLTSFTELRCPPQMPALS